MVQFAWGPSLATTLTQAQYLAHIYMIEAEKRMNRSLSSFSKGLSITNTKSELIDFFIDRLLDI